MPTHSETIPSDHSGSRSASVSGSSTMPHGWVSKSLRDLEHWVAWSIAAYSAWLGLFTFPDVAVIWFFVLYAGLVGKWAELKPSRNQAEMALRGVAMIAGAYALHTQTIEVGGAGGPFFFWLGITCLAYAFMLRPVWALVIVATAVCEFALVTLQADPGSMSSGVIAQNALACAFPLLLAMKFGAVMRRPDEALESTRLDTGTRLYNMVGLAAHGNEMLVGTRRAGQPASIAVFDCADLLEVRSIYGSRIARKVMAKVVDKLTALAGGPGLAARTGPAEFTVVLPGMGREKALSAIHKALGSPIRIEFDAGDSEIVLVPSIAVQAIGNEVESIEEVYEVLHRELLQMDEEELRRQHYLQRERERHSRPMGVVNLPHPAPTSRGARVKLSKTAPAPLGAN